MKYVESYPDSIFSHHAESYWQVDVPASPKGESFGILLPTCTFNIIFTNQHCAVKQTLTGVWKPIPPGAYFIGQTNNCLDIRSDTPMIVHGIRFKPFAFANILNIPVFKLNDNIVTLGQLFKLDNSLSALIQMIVDDVDYESRKQLIDELLGKLLSQEMTVDEKLRAQLNYIMDRQGCLKIVEVLEEFNTSKVTLRKHFVNKVGLTPKKVAQIWRMNRLLQLAEMTDDRNLTSLCLEVGFYDQSHFIKSFRQIFGEAPKHFLSQKSNLIRVTNLNISKRFTQQYDPRL